MIKNKHRLFNSLSLVLAALLITADQLTKNWAQNVLNPKGDIPIWENVLHFHYATNTGAAFSMFENMQLLFKVVGLVASLALIVYILMYKHRLNTLAFISFSLILTGAIGNFIDRVRYNYVIDFIYFKLINFAIFNIADACVVVGAILLCIYVIFFHDKYENKLKNETVFSN